MNSVTKLSTGMTMAYSLIYSNTNSNLFFFHFVKFTDKL